MIIKKKQFVVYGFRFEEDELTKAQLEEFYDKYECLDAEMGTVFFLDSGMIGCHYWLGYLLAYGSDIRDLGIVLDDEIHNESIRKMRDFLEENNLQAFQDTHHLCFHIITRWG